MTTTLPDAKNLGRQWLLVDADGQALGRLASRLAMILRGKHKPIFTPFMDTGDFVVVINVKKLRITGRKISQKTYQRYSGYPSGLRVQTMEKVMDAHPDRVLRQAVKGMLPEGPLGRRMLGKLKIYPGTDHPHKAQAPQPINRILLPS